MTTSYTRTGKQILLDGKHMADAVDDTAAMMILNALRGMEQREPPAAVDLSERIDPHLQRREADEYACSCGLRWSVGEDDPHG